MVQYKYQNRVHDVLGAIEEVFGILTELQTRYQQLERTCEQSFEAFDEVMHWEYCEILGQIAGIEFPSMDGIPGVVLCDRVTTCLQIPVQRMTKASAAVELGNIEAWLGAINEVLEANHTGDPRAVQLAETLRDIKNAISEMVLPVQP